MSTKLEVDLSTNKVIYVNGYKIGRIIRMDITFGLDSDIRTSIRLIINDEDGTDHTERFFIKKSSLRIGTIKGKLGIQKVSFLTFNKNDLKALRVK